MNVLKEISLVSKGLKYKLMVAFSLMTVIPLLACVYLLSPYLVPDFQGILQLSIVIMAVVIISLLGFFIAMSIVNSVVAVAGEAHRISNGDYDRRIDLPEGDEVGKLGQSINTMTRKIKSNLEELKKYGQNIKEINTEIQKRVAALSSLLEIDEVISSGTAQIDSLLELGVGKASNIFDMGFGALYMPRSDGGDFIAKVCFNADEEKLKDVVIKARGRGVLERAIEEKKLICVSGGMKITRELEEFKASHNLVNFIAIPLHSERAVFGLLLLGNRLSDFIYSKDDIELASVFAKHITIAIESDILDRKSRELATKDDLTGLFNKRYLLVRLGEEIKRAVFYQRPCSFAAFRIDNFKSFREAGGDAAAEDTLKRIAKVINDNNVPIGMAARISAGEFAILMPEKNKREAIGIAEDIRRKIERVSLSRDGKTCFTASVGVSENPIDGATGDEIYVKAVGALGKAEGPGGRAQR